MTNRKSITQERTETMVKNTIESVRYRRLRPGTEPRFSVKRVAGETAVFARKLASPGASPVQLVDSAIKLVDEMKREKGRELYVLNASDSKVAAIFAEKMSTPWGRADFLAKAMEKAHRKLQSEASLGTTAGLYRAKQWDEAYGLLRAKFDDEDRQSKLVESSLTHSWSFRYKEVNSSRKPYGWWLTKSLRFETHLIESLKDTLPRPKISLPGLVKVPVAVNKDGKKIWEPILNLDARLPMKTDWDRGQKESWTPMAVTVQTASGEHKLSWVSGSIRELGQSEMGEIFDDFTPLPEPKGKNQQKEIRRNAWSSSVEKLNGDEDTFDVVVEEKPNRRYTYNPEAEEEWEFFLLETLEDVQKTSELGALWEEVNRLWKAKAFRYHVYQSIKDQIVDFVQDNDYLSAHPVFGKWSRPGDEDRKVPEIGAKLRYDLWKNAENRKALKSSKGTAAALRRNLEENKRLRQNLRKFEEEKALSIKLAWENYLKAVGLGSGRDGQPFGDHSEDALEQKDARGAFLGTETVDVESSYDELMDIDGVGPKTLEAFQEAGFETMEEINALTIDEINEVVHNGRRAAAIWWCGAGLLFADERTNVDLGYMAMSRFGSSRGTSVDLVKPFWRAEPRKVNSSRPKIEEYSISDAEIAIWANGLAIAPVKTTEVPAIHGFKNVEEAVRNLLVINTRNLHSKNGGEW